MYLKIILLGADTLFNYRQLINKEKKYAGVFKKQNKSFVSFVALTLNCLTLK